MFRRVSWSLTSLFSTNMAISETNVPQRILNTESVRITGRGLYTMTVFLSVNQQCQNIERN